VSNHNFHRPESPLTGAIRRDIPYVSIPTLGPIASDEVQAWMARKSDSSMIARVARQHEKATTRGSRGTTIPLADLARLLAMVNS
jgi:hypothetical protein